ncbi:hypothetical protein LB554_12950 [Mesorhizobium sp. CO1-1-11]|uniref:hypothetical protein n=1 Tax=Mesorhizobium sp. CO1-1-11 TaxID=2876636 RepID=UPI001CCBA9DE|nr:hypothetical protein [Mesorhizobium sp. CO1-1-11]MBZ9724857.1 hypothetical protein [Mesorhizobium sp. CO1-1-11]
MNFLAQGNRADVSNASGAPGQSTVWVEEALFGHRLWPRQTPWLLFLEFLNVAEAFHRMDAQTAFTPRAPDRLHPYKMRFRLALRAILFSNDDMERIAAASDDSESQWAEWLATMQGLSAGTDFEYLRDRFSSFRDFAELVGLVRQTKLENEHNRRSTSRFIFPFGVDALFSDAIHNDKTGAITADFNNFGRTGEILYMMASRAKRGSELRASFATLFDPNQPKNRLIARLSAPSDDETNRDQKGETYLPYLQHPAFDRLAEDWIAIFAIGLPAQDAFAHLVPIGTLHVVLYQLETAAALAGRPVRPALVCELIAPKREFVRQRSIISYQDNDSLTLRALDAAINRFEEELEWLALLSEEVSDQERADRAADLIEARFHYRETAGRSTAPHDLVANLRREVEEKHEVGAGRVHSSYTRQIGLSSSRGTNRMRYAPNDALLKTLVVTRVAQRVEFKRFLSDLYQHYGLVFGEAEARAALDPAEFDAAAFERNRARLEARLASMGLLQRLSDGCAYVVNPFSVEQ